MRIQGMLHIRIVALALLIFVITGCSSKPLNPWSADYPPQAMVPVAEAGIQDKRGRFREIYCEVLESKGEEWPDYRPCKEALMQVANEPPGTGAEVNLGQSDHQSLSVIVPGVGWECMENWLGIDESIRSLLESYGYAAELIDVDGLSSSANNARQIRDQVMSLPEEYRDKTIVLMGYSKGAPDILEAIVNYPELQEKVTAVVSVAGAVGGSPLANDASQSQLNIMRHFPKSDCSEGDGGALESLRPETRRTWLAENPLPDSIQYYSLVTYPHPDLISSVLNSTYKNLSKVDARNDSQVIYYDQMIPNSTLVGFVNADHWAVAVPVARTHTFLGKTFVDKNDYPREALFEALLRFIDEDLQDKPEG
jgi:triacylglycerol esterase/lipase EstA (alpha/beta hydrolase family)